VKAEVLARGPWTPEQVRTWWARKPFEPEPHVAAQADAAIAELGRRGSPTHDGEGARLDAWDRRTDALDLTLQPARWALRLADDAQESLSTLCVVRDSGGRWLAGRRAAWVASWAGRWALGAGGAVEVGERPERTLTRELEEEWAVRPAGLTVEALVRNPNGLVLLVGMARLAPGTEITRDAEHDAHAWWPADPADWPAEADAPLRAMAALLTSS